MFSGGNLDNPSQLEVAREISVHAQKGFLALAGVPPRVGRAIAHPAPMQNGRPRRPFCIANLETAYRISIASELVTATGLPALVT
jgi:hypothetical protein